MNDILNQLTPNNHKEYQVSLDKGLANDGIDIFNYLLENNKITPTHTYENITYRWAYGADGGDSIAKVANNLPPKYRKIFEENIIDYLGIRNLFTNEIKFEILGPNKYIDDLHLRRCRFGDLKPIKEDIQSTNYSEELFYSSLWHTDKSFELNNYKLLVYLNDIKPNQGGLVIADPIISPKFINNKCVLLKENSYINVDEITEKEIVGEVGTTASFNSHILHRANLPTEGYRYCMHLSFLLPDTQYYHHKYSKNHFVK